MDTKREEDDVLKEKSDISSAVRDIAEKLSISSFSERASAQRTVSSSIGAETPISILTDIRESQVRLLDVAKTLVDIASESEKRAELRHREVCTILIGMSQGVSQRSGQHKVPSDTDAYSTATSQKSTSYYGSYTVSNGTYLVACILVHIDAMLINHPQFRKIKSTDRTFMEVKDWYNLCSGVLNSDKDSKNGLRIPKPSDEDFKSACRLVASPVQGRRPSCDPSHLSSLLEHTPALMNTVEWVRRALLKCPGCISPERNCRLRSIEYPFVSSELDLNVTSSARLSMPKRENHQEFLDLKATERKEYMKLILDKSFSPRDAMSRVKKLS